MGVAQWQERITRDTYTRHLRDQRALTRELAAILRDASFDAQRIIARLSALDGMSYSIRAAQYSQSLRALAKLQAELWGDVNKSVLRGVERAAELGSNGTLLIDDFLFEALGAESALAGNAFNVAARNSVFNVTSRLLNDIRLSPLVYKNQALATGKVANAVNRGIALNRSAKEIAHSVKMFISPNVPGGQSYAAMRLGRTEINNAFHRTTIETGKEQPWVEGFKWNLSLSHKRPDSCNDLSTQDPDGLGAGVFAADNTPGKPHPQCLCYLTTVTIDVDEFIKRTVRGDYAGWIGSWS